MASAPEIAAEGSRVNFFTIKARKCERWKIKNSQYAVLAKRLRRTGNGS